MLMAAPIVEALWRMRKGVSRTKTSDIVDTDLDLEAVKLLTQAEAEN
jgi:hypothetical protein